MKTVMEYTPYPKSYYTVLYNGEKVGIGDKSQTISTAQWNWLTITSRVPFIWEKSKNIVGTQLPIAFPLKGTELYDMNQVFGGVSIFSLLLTSNPVEFYSWLSRYNLTKLKASQHYGSHEKLKQIMKERVLAWEQKRRKLTEEENKILKVAGEENGIY